MSSRAITLSEQLASVGEKVPYQTKQAFMKAQIAYYITKIIDNPKCYALCLDDFDDRATLLYMLLEDI
jgi:hypothetical protein